MSEPLPPGGTPYEWFRRADALLATGDADAALQLLDWLRDVEPASRAVLELRARAEFDTRRYSQSAATFDHIISLAPDDDYAHFGLGMSLWRLQRFVEARDHLAMAFVMRPERPDYGTALAQVKATLRARQDGGLPLDGPLPSQERLHNVDRGQAGES